MFVPGTPQADRAKHTFRVALLPVIFAACQTSQPMESADASSVHLVTVDPGHFHAALVQKSMYPEVDSVVHVYAPEGADVKLHLNRIESFNSRPDNPTRWKEEVYTGQDFFEKMLKDKPGNVVVLAGNNEKKTEYILQSLEAGYHVLADKPMVINTEDFDLLRSAFDKAKEKNLLLYDIMTERYEITTMLQKELSMMPEVFGTLEKGTPDNPAVTKESVHHFFKYVSGNILTRPPWFMDVEQEGEGIVDVTTHLVDLVQWACFPEEIIDYKTDIELITARRWPTEMTLHQFRTITKLDTFPGYLKKDVVRDSVLRVFSNGEINYKLRGVHAKVSVIWAYRAPEGAGDTHFSVMRGTKANLVIRQGREQGFKPALYIEPVQEDSQYEKILQGQLSVLEKKYPGLVLEKAPQGWTLKIPDSLKEGHEEHFARVMQKFLLYVKQGSLPEWEVPNMLAKYYTTTQALELARKTALP